ncbi:cellulose synthase subunit BcsC-related outer membrane protein [Geminocystis sp. GBBB08]|uniref:cellulose synthase subunit BcsC-related outer membrane protein n=1 Tax=Geminocystis sp. GBBB08 TaxID=2604140 RepID=UPI0027E39A9F|nr:cellulose synthase subunit BcsC-related outer membrane protein [Geminocystis sp. GBBB08]MBL1211580.1 hypothetical protein [Geminocystis sp. GBBB08]
MLQNKFLTIFIIIYIGLLSINKGKVLSNEEKANLLPLKIETFSQSDNKIITNLWLNKYEENTNNNYYQQFLLTENFPIKLLNIPVKTIFLIASPENFNPRLTKPEPVIQPETIKPKPSDNLVEELKKFPVTLESINPTFLVDTDNYGQRNQFIESTFNFRTLNNQEISLKTGFNTFEKPLEEKINNIPFILGWKGKINNVNLAINGGLEIFDRLPVAPSISIMGDTPLLVRVKPNGELQSLFVLASALEYLPYKFNAPTLDNQIKTFRFRPSFYWLIAPDISLFSFSQFGNFNDGNKDYQSFTRLEKKFGELSVSANLFTWSFHQNLEQKSGYFSPSDFLVYNLELAWQKNITNFLHCRLMASLGQQRLNGEFSNAQVYEGFCTGKFSENISLGLGYKISNIITLETGASSYLNEQFRGQLQIKF